MLQVNNVCDASGSVLSVASTRARTAVHATPLVPPQPFGRKANEVALLSVAAPEGVVRFALTVQSGLPLDLAAITAFVGQAMSLWVPAIMSVAAARFTEIVPLVAPAARD